MFPLVLSTLAQTKTKYNIPELYLFGSFVKCQENDQSDVDIAVRLKKTDALLLVHILNETREKLRRKVNITQIAS